MPEQYNAQQFGQVITTFEMSRTCILSHQTAVIDNLIYHVVVYIRKKLLLPQRPDEIALQPAWLFTNHPTNVCRSGFAYLSPALLKVFILHLQLIRLDNANVPSWQTIKPREKKVQCVGCNRNSATKFPYITHSNFQWVGCIRFGLIHTPS